MSTASKIPINYSNFQFITIDKQLPNFARASSGEFLYGNEANYAFSNVLMILCTSHVQLVSLHIVTQHQKLGFSMCKTVTMYLAKKIHTIRCYQNKYTIEKNKSISDFIHPNSKSLENPY